jgi:NADH-quinone oxidoreductase subunit L
MPELQYSGSLQTVEFTGVLLWIVLLPLLGAALNALVGWRLQRSDWGKELSSRLHIGNLSVSAIAIGALTISFCLSVWQVVRVGLLPHENRFLYNHLWPMIRVGTFDVSFDLSLDALSSVMLLVVTGVGLLIHIYACGYMQTEPSYWRFFSFLNLFIFSMLLLILGDNFIVMFFGWEGVGLCSYLLIGFWYRDYKKASAGTKAFLTNRIGDFGFLVGMLALIWGLGGSWSGGDYVPDQIPRLVPVVVQADEPAEHGKERNGAEHGAAASERAQGHSAAGPGAPHVPESKIVDSGAKALLTFTAFPGAKVYVDNDMSKPFGVAPFIRREMTGQRHSFRIAMGGATEDLSIDHALIPPDKETVLAAVGPVVSFRQLQDQLNIRDSTGGQPFRKGLQGKTLFGMSLITFVCIGLFIGATGKSAQIPLYVWLPDAMAGPTPVSALIHAATMVTAGVYMVARLHFLFSLSPTACGIVAFVGASTALVAASIGFFQYDIKKVLAYSTVSQLGFMFIGVGVGAYWAAIFHLMTHAFFKACLFLGSGSVIHGMHAVEHDADRAQDMRIMGGLGKVMPVTRATYLVACLAITAAPVPLFAGFWSKDEILWKAFTTQNTGWAPGWMIWLMGLTAAVGTSFYMWRSYYLTFEGKPVTADIPKKVHESPRVMTWVLVVLAFLSTIGGVLFGYSSHLVGEHGEPLLEQWLHPALRHAQVAFEQPGLMIEYVLMLGSVALAIASWSVAKKRYGAGRAKNWEQVEQHLPGFHWIHNKYFLDEIYQATVIAAVLRLRLVLRDMDTWVIDGLVNFCGWMTRATAFINGAIDRYLVDGAVNLVATVTLRTGGRLRQIQTGRIQSYAFGLLGGVAALAIIQFLVRYYGAR